MKTLVLFYSLDGNTRVIAEAIGKEIGADIVEIKRKKEFKHKGFLKIALGGFEVVKKRNPEILPLGVNLKEYDMIFIGTPVWAGNFNAVFRTLFMTEKFKEKSVALFCTFGGGEGKTFVELKKALDTSIIVGEKGFKLPLKINKEENEVQAKKWAQEIMKRV